MVLKTCLEVKYTFKKHVVKNYERFNINMLYHVPICPTNRSKGLDSCTKLSETTATL